jgi:hypothetical protein
MPRGPNKKAWGAIFWMFALLSFVASVLSIVSLVEATVVGWQWRPVARLVVETWNDFLDDLFTRVPLGAFFEWVLAQIAEYLNLSSIPTLYPHWKHVFILLMAVFGSYGKAMLAEGRKGFVIYGMAVGLLIALISALVSGVVPLDPNDQLSNVVVASAPSVLFFLAVYVIWLPIKDEPYESHSFVAFLIRAVVTFSISAGATLILMQVDGVRSNLHAGLLSLTGFAFVVAFHRMYCGWDSAKKKAKAPWQQFFAEPLTRRGLYIIYAFIGATLFAVLGAAERL